VIHLRRWSIVLILAATSGIAIFAWAAREPDSGAPKLVRVGGMSNACTCTHRIEP
jgi:hypothetical protein